MSDLNIFRKFFLSDKVKVGTNRLEYLGQSLDRDLPRAKAIIQREGLNLIAQTVGDMASFKRFEVIIKQ